VDSQFGSCGNTSNKEEEGVEHIKPNHEGWVEGEVLIEGRWY
jgi:hypothetical protein